MVGPMYLPQFDDTAKRVLEILLPRGTVPGSELLRQMKVDPGTLIDAIVTLQNEKLVQASGDFLQPSSLPFANFAIRPSAKDLAFLVAKQK